MKLDFTRTGRLEHAPLVLLNEIAERHRADVVRCIEDLGREHEQDIDWWVSELASRNTFTNPLFTWFCQALLVDRMLDSRAAVNEVTVDAWPLYQVLRDVVRRRNSSVRVRWAGSLRDRFAWRPRVPLSFARAFVEFVFARVNPPKTPWQPPEAAVLLDVFLYDHSFPQGEYEDRYYGGFGGYVDEATWRSMAYWPTFHTTIRRTWSIIKALRASKRRFILTQDFIHFSDLVYAWLYPIRALKHRPAPTCAAAIDVTPMVRAIWRRHLTDPSAIDALLKYRLARRLSQSEVRVRLVVDWFENQGIDKGANLGFRRFHPATVIVGYEGYIIPRHYLGMYPSQREFDSMVLPHSVAVIGRGFVEDRREFCPSIDIRVAPAFRFMGVWKPRTRRSDPAFITILVAPHLSLSNSLDVLRAIAEATAVGLPANARIWMRPHPAAPPLDDLARFAGIALPEHEIATGDFTAVLEQSDVLVSNTSSTCLEALAKGIPVAVIASTNRPLQNPIPRSVPNDLWRVCFGAQEVAAAIRELPAEARSSRNDALAYSVREEFVEPVTEAGVVAFLQLPAGRQAGA